MNNIPNFEVKYQDQDQNDEKINSNEKLYKQTSNPSIISSNSSNFMLISCAVEVPSLIRLLTSSFFSKDSSLSHRPGVRPEAIVKVDSR